MEMLLETCSGTQILYQPVEGNRKEGQTRLIQERLGGGGANVRRTRYCLREWKQDTDKRRMTIQEKRNNEPAG